MAASNNRPEIDSSAFSGLFGRVANALDPYTEGSKVGVLASLMAGFSAYIGHGPTVETGKGDSPLALWAVLVGPSGLGRKGTATGIAMRVLESAFKTFAEENTVYGLPATGLGYIGELDERATSGTANPVLFIEEEGDTFIANARRDAKVGVYLRKSWDGQTIAHKTKNDDVKVRRPHCGVIMHCQPKNWAAIRGTKDATGGTYNRFAVFYVYQSKTLPVFEANDSSEVIRACARELRTAAEFAREVDTVTVPKHVAEVFESKHRPIVEAMTTASEDLSQYTERAMAYLVRMAALYALSDRRDEISTGDLDAALALISYSVESVSYILPEAEASQEISLAVRIESFLKEAGEAGIPAGEMYRRFNLKKSEMEAIVSGLSTVAIVKGRSTGGRPPVSYVYVPEGTEETEVAMMEEIETATLPTEVQALEVPSLPEEEDFWGESEEEKALAESLKAPQTTITEAPKEDVPSAVEALRARMEAPKEETEEEVKPSGMTPMEALQALLSGPSETDMETVTVEPAEKVEKVDLPKVATPMGSKVVPPVIFQAPASDDSDTFLVLVDEMAA